MLIPKEENINQFRIISLLSTERKILFGVVAKRLKDFSLRSKYIDTSVQKSGNTSVPGCLEHTVVITFPGKGQRKHG